MNILEGRLSLITGAGQGLGETLAKGLARHGAKVIVTDINPEAADKVAEAIRRTGAKAWSAQLDVTDRDACAHAAEFVAKSQGDIDILVNNAGICPRYGIDDPTGRAQWDAAMKINVEGALNTTTAFLPSLRKTKGSVINLASISAFVSTRTSVAYSTSKGALRMLTVSLAQEAAKDGVRVNAIAPGVMKTEMTEPTRNDPVRSAKFLERIPMNRYGEPDELVGPLVFLASDMSSYVTGTTIVADGGYLTL